MIDIVVVQDAQVWSFALVGSTGAISVLCVGWDLASSHDGKMWVVCEPGAVNESIRNGSKIVRRERVEGDGSC